MVRVAQFSTQALIAFALLLAVGIAFLVTGPHVAAHVPHSDRRMQRAPRLHGGPRQLFVAYPFLQNLLTESELLAGRHRHLLGRSGSGAGVDTGTYRLAWTQSASRARWRRPRQMLVVVLQRSSRLVFTSMATWWSSPIRPCVRDPPPSASLTRATSFRLATRSSAFALGVALGAVVRRVIPAMVLTIAGFAAVRGLFNFVIRQHLATILHTSFSLTSPATTGGIRIGGNINPADWILTTVTKNGAGKVFPRFGNGIDFQPNGDGSVTLRRRGVARTRFRAVWARVARDRPQRCERHCPSA